MDPNAMIAAYKALGAGLDRQRVAATLRPHLQVLGLVPNATGRTFSLHDEVVSTGWIVQRYGRETEIDGVKTGHVSFLKDDVFAAIQAAAAFYSSATGLESLGAGAGPGSVSRGPLTPCRSRPPRR